MDNQTLIIVWIVVLAVIALSASGKKDKQDKTEGFHTYYGYYKKYCPSCGWRSRYSCAKCTNCGYCIDKNGYGQCVPGDSNGPYFHDCSMWEYGDSYSYYPHSAITPVVTVKSQYPYYRWRLNRPWRWQDKYQRMRPVKK